MTKPKKTLPPFAELWRRMTPDERKAARAEMETEYIQQMKIGHILQHTEAQLHREAKSCVNELIEHCQRIA